MFAVTIQNEQFIELDEGRNDIKDLVRLPLTYSHMRYDLYSSTIISISWLSVPSSCVYLLSD